MTDADHKLRNLVVLLYVTGALLFLDQGIDLISTLLSAPVALGNAQWRFGAFGLFVTRGSVLIVADVMLWSAAVVLEHRRVLRALAVVHLVLAVALAAGLGLFGLDAVELRRQVPSGSGRRYDSAALRAATISLLGVVLLAWSGVRGWVASSPGSGGRRSSAVLMDGRKVKEVSR